jgi:hypothetical protein
MKKEYIVALISEPGEPKVYNLVNMEDFKDYIICSDDKYWESVEGQLFTEDEFRLEEGNYVDDQVYSTAMFAHPLI